ncbi:MAG: SpoIID/LytB domain-containing protein [Thermoanaerobaculia bacterium]
MTRRRFLTFGGALLAAPKLLARAVASGPEGRTLRILRTATGRVEKIPVEEYVAAVLPGEIGRRAPAVALEAQAVAARSYALARRTRHADDGADLCDGVHCQVFRGLGSATPETRAAAAATERMVLVQAGRIIAAPFHAVCGGRTARPRDVWDDEENPDLVPVEDDACAGAPGYSWTFSIPRKEIPRLAASLGIPEARFFEVFGRDDTGRVSMVRLAAPGGASRIVRGFDFRKAASEIWGWASVRSTAFEIAESRTEYFLSGHGTGHGAGMCQAGAIERARRGETRDAILALYYRGAAVATVDSAA